jgi:hypothetical protein
MPGEVKPTKIMSKKKRDVIPSRMLMCVCVFLKVLSLILYFLEIFF